MGAICLGQPDTRPHVAVKASTTFGGRWRTVARSGVQTPRQRNRPNGDDMNALQALIAAHVAATHESYAAIARRAGMSRQTVSSLAARDAAKQTPRPETLRKLAIGLGLDVNTVRAAAADAAGFQTIAVEDDDTLIIVAAMSELDAEQREALKRRAMSLLAEARAGNRFVNHNGDRDGGTPRPRQVARGKKSRRGLSRPGGAG